MKQQSKILQLLICAIITITFSGLLPLTSTAAVSARLDRQVISSDETVRLFIEADGARNSIANLDVSKLEKDFSITDQAVSNNFQIINGSSKATKTWTIELEPRRTGSFTIPSFTIGKEKTSSLTLTVTAPTPISSGTPGTRPNVFIELTPEMDSPAYLQAQITISVKLFINTQLRLGEASLEEPTLEHAAIIKLGDDRRFQSQKDGITYQVIERKHAIIAEEGREITIPPLVFQAISTNAGNRRFPADPFFNRFSDRGQRLRARSQELTISLTPVPDEFKGKIWLPARQMAIMENSDEKKELKIGEPLTRIIQIEALGLTAEQLPEITVKTPEGCKIYLDQPEHQTKIDGTMLHAVKRQSMAFIPSQEGLFTLPEITIDWWDVVNNKQKKAVLPARQIKVVKADGTNSEAKPQQAIVSPEKNLKKTGSDNPEPSMPTPENLAQKNTLQLWQGISALLLLAWIITLMLWINARRRPVGLRKEVIRSEKKQPANLETIKKTCLDNHPQAAHQAILNWAAASWPQNPPTNLNAIATRLENPELGKAFNNLEETLYSPNNLDWDGSHFWQTIAKKLQRKTPSKPSRNQKEGLPPLYSKKP